jgi:hypothetical protein
MKSFFKESSTKQSVKVLESCMPQILISSDAIIKMQLFIENCSEEVGWLGTAYLRDGVYYIEDVFLFEQEVHATTTEITPEGLSDFAMELLQQPDGVEIWNNMKVWGHSHVNMGVTPSGQDDAQMVTFKEGGHDWFIRLIANKKGDLKIDLYEYTNGLIYLDLPWEVVINENEDNIQAQIAILEEQLTLLRAEQSELNTIGISEEMKVKVRKKTYGTGANHSNWASRGNQSKNGGATSSKDDKKKDDKNENKNVPKGSATGSSFDYFESDDEVVENFSLTELFEFASCRTLTEVEQELMEYGWFDCFTDDDLERIYKVAIKTSTKLGGHHLDQFRR